MDLFTNPDLFNVIGEYTHLQSLCDTCTILLTFKQYFNYKLNDKYSLLYYTDISFRNRVLNKIFNPNKQLIIDLYDRVEITDVSVLGNVHSLNLYGCDNITDVSALGNVHTLNLSFCNITDVSMLGNVHTLDLHYCDNITDVSALGNVHTLDLNYCNITDVSALGNVHTLKLTGCKNITNDHTLDLRYCKKLRV